MEQNCLFCKITNKQIETNFLYEDEDLVVFKDIRPQAPTHLLIVPKKHIRSLNDIQEEDSDIIAKMFFTAKKMAKKECIDKSGYKTIFNVEKGGGQEIFHIHLHLIGGWKK